MYTQPGPSYDLIVLWMTSHISADTSVCGRWQGGSGSRATRKREEQNAKATKARQTRALPLVSEVRARSPTYLICPHFGNHIFCTVLG